MANALTSEGSGPPANARFELRRKVPHAIPGLIPFGLWFIYHEDPLPLWNLAVVAGAVALLTVVMALAFKNARRSSSESWTKTCVSYAAPLLITVGLFPGNVEYVSVMLCVLAFGDSAAALAGKLWGRSPIPWNGKKTWAGTLAFIVVAAPTAALAYWGEARPEVSPVEAVKCGVLASVVAALAESLPTDSDDNLRISMGALLGVLVGARV